MKQCKLYVDDTLVGTALGLIKNKTLHNVYLDKQAVLEFSKCLSNLISGQYKPLQIKCNEESIMLNKTEHYKNCWIELIYHQRKTNNQIILQNVEFECEEYTCNKIFKK